MKYKKNLLKYIFIFIIVVGALLFLSCGSMRPDIEPSYPLKLPSDIPTESLGSSAVITEPDIETESSSEPIETESGADETEPTESNGDGSSQIISDPEPEGGYYEYEDFPELPERFKSIKLPTHLTFTESRKNAVLSLNKMPSKDFGGIEFNILTTQPEVFTPINDDNRVNEARYYRNRLVEKQYNIKINSIVVPENDLYRTIEKAINTGEYIADVFCIPLKTQYQLYANGMLMNLTKVPFINLNAPYYNNSMLNASKTGNYVFEFSSDLTFDFDSCVVMIYNKSMIKRLGLTDPYEYFAKNTWTWDILFEYSKAFINDINIGEEGLKWGIAADGNNDNTVNAVFKSASTEFFTSGTDGFPVLGGQKDKLTQVIETLKKLLKNENNNMTLKTSDESIRSGAFVEGKALFNIVNLDSVRDYTSMSDEFGVLPFPSTESDGSNGYYTYVELSSISASIPSTYFNTEFCGMVIEALNAASYGHIKQEYVNEMMLYSLRNYNSVVAIRHIIDNIKYDFAYIASEQSEVYNASTGLLKSVALNNGDFNALYDKYATAVSNFINKNLKQ